MNWNPITKKELSEIIKSESTDLTREGMELFDKIKVPFENIQIHRAGKIEEVYVVAKYNGEVMFYEDVEEGFEMAKPDKQGIISEYSSNQFELQHVINQLLQRTNL